MKGFSALIVDTLKLYFDGTGKERAKSISQLKGCLSKEEIKRIEEGRKNWRT